MKAQFLCITGGTCILAANFYAIVTGEPLTTHAAIGVAMFWLSGVILFAAAAIVSAIEGRR